MRLPQPPQGASYRAHRMLDADLYVEPGQRLPACQGHRSISICTDGDGNRRGPDKRRSEAHDFPDICWAKVWARKHNLPYVLKSIEWRRQEIATGYRRLASFEAACHWWLCLDAGQLQTVHAHCSCTPEYRTWFRDQIINTNGPLDPVIFAATIGLAP